MTSKTRGRVMALSVLVVALTVGAVYAYKAAQPRPGKVRGTIASVDVASRTAVMDVIHPKTGLPFQVSGAVREDCKIDLENTPVRLEELHVGDTVEVRGLINRLTGSMVATEVRARRRGFSASAPTSEPATGAQGGGR